MCKEVGGGREEARGGSFVCLTDLMGKKNKKGNPKVQKTECRMAENLGRSFLNKS